MDPRPADETPAAGERESGLDETIEETFPASDPPSTIPDPPAPADEPRPAPRQARRWTDRGMTAAAGRGNLPTLR
jgi:hypothetical protein